MLGQVVRVVGPPGSGKSLLITSLQEALRQGGVRSAHVVSVREGVTAVTLSTGSRSTIDRDLPLGYLAQVVDWIDPTIDVVLAEGYEEPGAPAVEVRPEGAPPSTVPEEDRFAVVSAEEIALHFAQHGPGYTAGVAERIARELLGRELAVEEPSVEEAHSPEVERQVSRLQRMLGRLRR